MDREVLLGILNALNESLSEGEEAKDPELLEAIWPLFAEEIRGMSEEHAKGPDALGADVIQKLIAFLETPRQVAFAVMILKKALTEFPPTKD